MVDLEERTAWSCLRRKSGELYSAFSPITDALTSRFFSLLRAKSFGDLMGFTLMDLLLRGGG